MKSGIYLLGAGSLAGILNSALDVNKVNTSAMPPLMGSGDEPLNGSSPALNVAGDRSIAEGSRMQWGRMERRTPLGVVARLESAADPSAGEGETAFIENISNHGARVITDRSWQPNERLLLSSPGQGFRPTAARVVYCQSLLDNRFAIGLEFNVSIFDSMLGAARKVDRP